MHRILLAMMLLSLAVASAQAQIQVAPPPQSNSTIRSNVDEVLVDVVVRDKKGKPIYDVKPSDVTVTDNGVKQKLASFRLVQGAEAISSDGSRKPLDTLHQIRLVTPPFSGIGPDHRQLAPRPALHMIKGDQGT